MHSVECLIPRAAADALDLSTIRERARAAGVSEPTVEHAPARRGHDRVRIACSIPMALFLVDELRRLALESLPSPDRATRVAYGIAVASLYAGIDIARHPRGPNGSQRTAPT